MDALYIALAARQRINAAEENTDRWIDYANHVEGLLEQSQRRVKSDADTIADLRSQVAALEERAAEAAAIAEQLAASRRDAAALKAEVAQLKGEVKAAQTYQTVLRGYVAGHAAVARAFALSHPDSPLLHASQVSGGDGRPLSQRDVIFQGSYMGVDNDRVAFQTLYGDWYVKGGPVPVADDQEEPEITEARRLMEALEGGAQAATAPRR